jgi:hypothetical protein
MNGTIDERFKARLTGVMLAVVGVVAAAYPFFNGPMPRKAFVALLAMGPFLVWFSAGLAFVPVPESVFKRLEQSAELGTWFKELPRFWKFRAPLSLVVLVGAMIGADMLSR